MVETPVQQAYRWVMETVTDMLAEAFSDGESGLPPHHLSEYKDEIRQSLDDLLSVIREEGLE